MSEPTNNESNEVEKSTPASDTPATSETPAETPVAEQVVEATDTTDASTSEIVAESSPEDARIPELRPGYKVRVHSKIQQGDKERVQVFEGNIIAINGSSAVTRTITVRKIAAGGYGVERIWPLALPTLVKIEVLERPKVRRSKLYYLRGSLKKMKKLRERA